MKASADMGGGYDGSIFNPNSDYAPEKADFVEMPFDWVKIIDNGELSNRLRFLHDRLSKIYYPHLPSSVVAKAINIGVTNYLNDICADIDEENNSNHIYPDDFNLNCKKALAESPVQFESYDGDNSSNSISSLVYEKLGSYFGNIH